MSEMGQVQLLTTTACTMQIKDYHERREQQTRSEGREASQAQPESYPTHNLQLWREGKGRAYYTDIFLHTPTNEKVPYVRRIHRILGVF